MKNEQIEVTYEDEKITIPVIRYKTMKTARLLFRNGTAKVHASPTFPQKEIIDFITPHLDKIVDCYQRSSEIEMEEQTEFEEMTYELTLLGKKINLVRNWNLFEEVRLEGSNLIVDSVDYNDPEIVAELLKKWYRKECENILRKVYQEIYDLYFAKSCVKPELKFRNMKKQWGNYTKSKNSVTLNIKLGRIPSQLIEYVIIHELVHVFELNHSSKFYDVLAKIVENRKSYDEGLRQWSHVLRKLDFLW